MTFTMRAGAKWQNKAPVNGRAATANDVKQFILRNKEGKLRDGTVDASTFYRGAQYQLVDTVDTPDDKVEQHDQGFGVVRAMGLHVLELGGDVGFDERFQFRIIFL